MDRRSPIFERLDFVRRLPRMRVFSGVVVLGVIIILFGGPFLGPDKDLLSSGPLSVNHQMIENDCKACHAVPFEQVRDQECLACHKMTDHSDNYIEFVADHPDQSKRCAQCHMEHNGDPGLTLSDERSCTGCHDELSSIEDHPRFDLPKLDKAKLKLNHKIHLAPEGIKGPDGDEVLNCADCHSFTKDLKSTIPIRFERDCARCHPLTFDDRLEDVEVPHGDGDTVYNFIYAEYAKLFLNESEGGEGDSFNLRKRPGYQSKVDSSDDSNQFAKGVIEEESRRAEKELFERTACQLCHKVTRNKGVDPISKYKVVPPEVPELWMEKAVFSHGAHEEIACESCHDGVRESEKTKDLLLPQVGLCQSCHTGTEGKIFYHYGKVRSDCTVCHSFHDPLHLDPEVKRFLK